MRWFIMLMLAVGSVSIAGQNSAPKVGAATTQISAYRQNLLANPDAETTGGWMVELGTLDTIAYGTPEFPDSTSPGPFNRGMNFFGGGAVDKTIASQSISLTDLAQPIDAGKVRVSASGWFGGHTTQTDLAYLEVNIHDGTGAFLDQLLIGFVSATDRQNVTGLFPESGSMLLPATARSLNVRLQMERVSGPYNDGYADNLVVLLESIHTVYVPLLRR